MLHHSKPFESRENKLSHNVYGSLKGRIRMELILADIYDYFPEFDNGGLSVLDIGGGAGLFAAECLKRGHTVTYCDCNSTMLQQAMDMNREFSDRGQLLCYEMDFLTDHLIFKKRYDLVVMHGSAEWMADPDKAVKKACSLARPGGVLSLLLFNRDKEILKKGIGGRLCKELKKKQKKKLTPPGGRSPEEVRHLLAESPGTLLLMSGIRIFYSFFRHNDRTLLQPDEWLDQERKYYRTHPFSILGEHTHFLYEIS